MDNNNTLVHLENNKKGLFHLSIIQYFLDAIHIMNLYATSIINDCIII